MVQISLQNSAGKVVFSTVESLARNPPWAPTGVKESTPLNKLAVADAAWARMPVDSLNMTLA